MTPRPREAGYALVAALVGLLAFAAVAFELTAASRAAHAGFDAERTRARLAAAAGAGLTLAILGLSQGDRAARWTIDGRPRRLAFDGVDLTVAVEDERGKIPLNIISEREARRMFEAAGATGRDLDVLVDSFLDWRDDDEDRRPFGAESRDYARRGYRARDGDLRSLDELARIQGMTPALFAALAPATTLFFGDSGGFSERNAPPLALAAMGTGGVDVPGAIQRRRELLGDRPALEAIPTSDALLGRALTVRVTARDGRGGALRRATVIEFTGGRDRPVWIRARD